VNPPDALVEHILLAIERQKTWDQWTKDSGQFIPHPATWLSQGRWDDEPPEAQASMMSAKTRQNIRNAGETLRMLADREADDDEG
jgi:hypothetical protein